MSGREAAKLLFIGGSGRSGSTLLERMLGQLDGFCSVLENQLCGCGSPFHECPFWSAVGAKAFGGWLSSDADRAIRLDGAVDRHRFFPLLLAPGLWPSFADHLEEYVDILQRLYEAIQVVSGAELLIDSTADPSYALVLRRMAGFDLRIAHLVRDARGVAFSWGKRVVRPEITDRVVFMPTYGPARATALWMIFNAVLEAHGLLGLPRQLVRYEDLIDDPRGQLGRVLSFALREVKADDFSFIHDDTLTLRPTHTVAGNPMRFDPTIRLRLDEAWRSGLSWDRKATVNALAWPLLARYGYLSPARRLPGIRWA
jgi:hypothetical protein